MSVLEFVWPETLQSCYQLASSRSFLSPWDMEQRRWDQGKAVCCQVGKPHGPRAEKQSRRERLVKAVILYGLLMNSSL